MAAGDHLSGQFEVVAKHRAVRMGGRVYPAVDTNAIGPTIHTALVPMENGGLASVEHHRFGESQEYGGWSINEPRHQMGRSKGPNDPHDHLFDMSHTFSADDPGADQKLHDALTGISQKHLGPESVQKNRKWMELVKGIHEEGY